MNLYQKIKFYLHLKRKNYRNAFITAFTNNKLTAGDFYFITLFICMVLICLTLHFKEKIDNYHAKLHQKIERLYAQNAQNAILARKNELLVVSMLNGKIIIDNRLKSLCVYDAGGDCKVGNF